MRTHLKEEHPDAASLTSFEEAYRLPRNVSAIPILSTELEGRSPLGLMTQLPEGAQIELAGPGFNDYTVKVRYAGASYYVFLEDLEPQRKRVASAR